MLGKLLIGYISSIVSSTSNIILRALNVSNCSRRAGSKSIQAETQLLPLETDTNIVKHEKTSSFCQKGECLHAVNYSATAQLLGIRLTQ